jgi:GMP synthase (glutamine-hydrolysing)
MLSTFKSATENALSEVAEEKRIRKTKEVFLLFALGSQFDHLIKLMLEKLGVFCLVADPSTVTAEDVRKLGPIGIILSGGPASVHAEPPPFDSAIFDLCIPVLGICLGFQMWAKHVGAIVKGGRNREFGAHYIWVQATSPLFLGCPGEMQVLESHGDIVGSTHGMEVVARTEHAPVAAAQHGYLFGVQFHPEVTETMHGEQMFWNFCFSICHAKDQFPAKDVAHMKIDRIRQEIGENKVVLALSGGSDSSVVAHLLRHAVDEKPGRIHAVYIKGIDRPDDEAHVQEYFGSVPWLDLRFVDATSRFLRALKGTCDMPGKREAMRGIYRQILEEEALDSGALFIAQGTLYTDISESGGGYESGARKAKIKQHHNVNLGFSVPELTPLDDCVKDGARNIGREIGVPEALLTRHPFPGPGLVVRIEGRIDKEKLRIARAADAIFIEELRRWKLYETVWQAGVTVLNSLATCTKGDDAVSGIVLCFWAFWSVNGFTAQAADLPYDFRKHVARRFTNEIREVGRVVYNDTDKPPGTIEWG